jgi:hypothetical protein
MHFLAGNLQRQERSEHFLVMYRIKRNGTLVMGAVGLRNQWE